MRRISRTLISNLAASMENEEVRDPSEQLPADAVVETPASTTPPATSETPPEVQTTAEVVVTTASAEVPVAAEAPAVTPEGQQVAPATEGIKGALIGGAAGAFGPLGGAIGGHYAEKHIDELKAKIEKLEEENKNLRTGKHIAKEDGEVTSDEVAEVPADVPATDASPEVGAEVPSEETPPIETPVETPVAEPAPQAPAAEVAAQAAAAALAEAGVPEETRVVVTVVEPALSEDEQNELADQGEEIESDLEQATQAATEAEEVCDEVSTLLDTGAEVAQYGQIASDASQNGGLSDDAARILTVAVEAAYERVGLSGYCGIPSMESFQGKHSRVGATTIAMEDIAGKLKSFGAAIVEGAKKFLEFLSNFFKSIFTATGRIEARAKKILEAVKTFKGNSSSELTSPGLFKKLAVGTSVPADLAGGMKLINDFVAEATSPAKSERLIAITESIKNIQKEQKEALKSAFTPGKDSKEDVEKYGKSVSKHAEDTMEFLDFRKIAELLNLNILKATNTAKASEFGIEEGPEGTTLVSSPILPGNKMIWAHIPNEGSNPLNFHIGIGSYDHEGSGKLPNLNSSQIEKIAHEALRFVEIRRGFEENYKKVQLAIQNIANLGVAAGAMGSFDSKENVSFSSVFKVIKDGYRFVSNVAKGFSFISISEATRVHNAALDYAQLALASGTKSKEAPKQLAAA